MSRFYIKLFLLLFFTGQILAQELPPTINYAPSAYLGGNQNWSISQGENKIIYIANNDGLLTFNGSKWSIYQSPNKAIVRSVSAVDDRIYTGTYMDFGFWLPDAQGSLQYKSLSDQLEVNLIEDEQFWNIIPHNKWILFQSLDRIYIYDATSDEIRFIEDEGTINKIFKIGDDIYFQILGKGLYTIDNGEKMLVYSDPLFIERVIIGILEIDGRLVFTTQNGGFYERKSGKFFKWSIEAPLDGLSVYSVMQLKDQTIVLGTIGKGVYLLSKQGSIIFHMDQSNGLGDNTALSLFEGNEGSIWVGLDNGLDCINLPAPFTNYVDQDGRLGTTYAAINHNSYLYIGTNQGLFYKSRNSNDEFKFIENTEGQVWSLQLIGSDLFCGHNNGTFLIEKGKAERIANVMGTWSVQSIPDREDMLIQGNYTGLYILVKSNDKWVLSHKLTGFDISSKHFEFVPDNKIIVNHEYKGLYSLHLNENLTKVDKYVRLDDFNNGANSSLTTFGEDVFYASGDGIYKYNQQEQNFKKEETVSTIFDNNEYVSGKLVADNQDRLWVFTKNYITYISEEKLSPIFNIKKIAIPESYRNGMKGYENITAVGENSYLLGTSNGYLLMSLDKLVPKNYNVLLHSVFNGTRSDSLQLVDIATKGGFGPSSNYLTFEYSVPEYEKFLVAEYQHHLQGWQDDTWSDWTNEATASYENLPFGDYTFQVRAKINNVMVNNIASYAFRIDRPWYISNIAIIVYAVALLLFFMLINTFYKRFYRKQRERIIERKSREMELKELETQKEIIQLRNESLNKDIEARNRELAISTMSMIKKNNALSSVKEALIKSSDLKSVKPVVSLINKTLNDTDDWKFFEKAFNHADKDFFKKLKDKHPDLTPNDLRLCVYLRLNLSSKEIAPLLNISPRSVEIKRYRLRKKIQLDRETNLNDYFIDL